MGTRLFFSRYQQSIKDPFEQNTGALNEALLIYDKVLRVLPTNADTHHNRGNALYQAARPSPHAAAEPTIIGLVRCRLRLRPGNAIVSGRAR